MRWTRPTKQEHSPSTGMRMVACINLRPIRYQRRRLQVPTLTRPVLAKASQVGSFASGRHSGSCGGTASTIIAKRAVRPWHAVTAPSSVLHCTYSLAAFACSPAAVLDDGLLVYDFGSLLRLYPPPESHLTNISRMIEKI